MNVRVIWFVLLGLLAASPATAQGFAGLGGDATGFAMPHQPAEFRFPADHGPHPDFRVEWWYVTANLNGPDGRPLGIQWTLFRTALRPGEADGWQSPQLWMGHAAVTSPDAHLFAEKIGRGGTGQAGVAAAPFAAWIDDWAMTSTATPDADALSALRLSAAGTGFFYALELSAKGPLVAHGDAGYSVKSAQGQASYYYSQPFYTVRGTLRLPSGEVPVTGHGWLDHEWSSQPLAADQSGWDWLALTLEDGERIMAFRLRGGRGDFTAASRISPDGRVRALPDGTFGLAPLETAIVAGRKIPVRWRLTLPPGAGAAPIDVELTALNRQSWMGTSVPYWEGPITVSGSHRGTGYLEMTGYAPTGPGAAGSDAELDSELGGG